MSLNHPGERIFPLWEAGQTKLSALPLPWPCWSLVNQGLGERQIPNFLLGADPSLAQPPLSPLQIRADPPQPAAGAITQLISALNTQKCHQIPSWAIILQDKDLGPRHPPRFQPGLLGLLKFATSLWAKTAEKWGQCKPLKLHFPFGFQLRTTITADSTGIQHHYFVSSSYHL